MGVRRCNEISSYEQKGPQWKGLRNIWCLRDPKADDVILIPKELPGYWRCPALCEGPSDISEV